MPVISGVDYMWETCLDLFLCSNSFLQTADITILTETFAQGETQRVPF